MITLESNKIKVSGPTVDGSFNVTFNIGEYMQKEVGLLLSIPQMKRVKVTVEPASDE